MRKVYQIPLSKELLLGAMLEDPFCGVSGGEYNPNPGEFDPDSD